MSWFDHNREVTERIGDLLYRGAAKAAARHAIQKLNRMIRNLNQLVESFTVSDLPLVFTDSMPFCAAAFVL